VIEFNADGPFAPKPDQLFPDRVRIVGLGQTGVSVADQLVLHGRPPRDLWVFDSDQQMIDGSIVPNRHLLGRELVHGLGCSGDLGLAREVVAQEEERLAQLAQGCDFLVLILSFAGSTGVAVAEHLAQIGRQAGAKVMIVGVLPFAFEGPSRREKSVEAIALLRQQADSVLVLAHDRVSDSAMSLKNVRHGFHLMHRLLARTAQALGQIVCKRGLVQLSFADVRSLYGRYTGAEVLENCWIGHVEGDTGQACDDLVTELLSGPMLADEAIWDQVDHAVVTVSGSQHLGLSDVQELIGALKDRLPEKMPLVVSANPEDDNLDQVSMTLLLACTAPSAAVAPAAPVRPASKPASKPAPAVVAPIVEQKIIRPAPEPVRKKIVEDLPVEAAEPAELLPLVGRTPARQEEMIFEGPARGRFEKTHETIYRGENLDQPTFRRRGLKIRV
jgi:cell division protein FtsZ